MQLTNMITLISGTSRLGSNTLKVANTYEKLLAEAKMPFRLLDLASHNVTIRNDAFSTIENEFLIPAEKFIFILPEYNGSFPGIVKLMIDNSTVSACWHHKKALLTGVSTGRAGNLRGMEHFTGSLMHMKMTVHPNRLPISMVDKCLNNNNLIGDEGTFIAIKQQLADFLSY